jgi:hypothetical protein
MAYLCYLIRRLSAIGLGLALTGYSAWASWTHQGDLIGPLAAVSAAGMLIFAEHAWRDRKWFHFGGLAFLGMAAAIISGSVVLDRVSHASESRNHAAQSSNLPRTEARKALAEAQTALKTAEAAASAECSSGRGRRCDALESREKAARARVDEARAKLSGLGAEVTVNPAVSILGSHAATLQLATLLGLPLWLELAAPIVLAYGFAPGPRKEPEPKKKAKRRKEKRAPRKPAQQDGVTDWVEAYRQKHGHAPKVADVRQAFGVSKTTAWRRIRSAS